MCDVAGRDQPVSYKNKHLLPYTEAVMLETLRLAAIATVPLPHTLERDTVVGDQVPFMIIA